MDFFKYLSHLDNFIFSKYFLVFYCFMLIIFPPIAQYIRLKKFMRCEYDAERLLLEMKQHKIKSVLMMYICFDISLIMISPITITLAMMVVSLILFIFLDVLPWLYHLLIFLF